MILGLAPKLLTVTIIKIAYIISRNNCFYVVAYDGVDPVTGRERRRWRRPAHRALACDINRKWDDSARSPAPTYLSAVTILWPLGGFRRPKLVLTAGLLAEADGTRTRQRRVPPLTGFEDRGAHQERVRLRA